MRAKFFVCCIAATILSFPAGSRTRINVSSQQEFDRLDRLISISMENGDKDIEVSFKAGTYKYDNRALQLKGASSATKIRINGNGSVLVGKGADTGVGAQVSKDFAYMGPGYSFADLWTTVEQSPEHIEVVSPETKMCRIKVSDRSDLTGGVSMIQISKWFKTGIYKVDSYKDGYAYFVADDLKYSEKYSDYSINADRFYGHMPPRYRFWKGVSETPLYESRVPNFANLDHISIGSLIIEGFRFQGCAAKRGAVALIRVETVDAGEIIIRGCDFQGCRANCINFENTANCLVTDCTFEHNYEFCVFAGNSTSRISVTNCRFEDSSIGWNNTRCVYLRSEDFTVADSEFVDFAYGAIGFGVWFGNKQVRPVTGVVERNHIHYTKAYFDDYAKHTLMDGGAISVTTKCDGVTIRDNWIHDYVGMRQNRGIFLDDGARNVKIYGNVILNIPNSFCIDSRRVGRVEDKAGKTNLNNEIAGNVMDGPYKLEGREGEENGCVQGTNVILRKEESVLDKCIVKNAKVTGNDIEVECLDITDGRIKVAPDAMKRIKKVPRLNSKNINYINNL